MIHSKSSQKVFGIGFHKTATTSLATALDLLGYRVTGPNGINGPHIAINAYRRMDSLIKKYDAFQDNPWPLLFREVDAKYPGSKFILTVRPVDRWLASVSRHFGSDTTPMREWIYGVGTPLGNESVYTRRYEEHNNAVIDYFKDRADDLLIMDITEGDGWERLCPFLGREIPDRPFPVANEASSRENASKVVRVIRRQLRVLKNF